MSIFKFGRRNNNDNYIVNDEEAVKALKTLHTYCKERCNCRRECVLYDTYSRCVFSHNDAPQDIDMEKFIDMEHIEL